MRLFPTARSAERGRLVVLAGTVNSRSADPASLPRGGTSHDRPENTLQLHASEVSMRSEILPPVTGTSTLSGVTLYWQTGASPMRTRQTPRPCVKANSVTPPPLRSIASDSTTVLG